MSFCTTCDSKKHQLLGKTVGSAASIGAQGRGLRLKSRTQPVCRISYIQTSCCKEKQTQCSRMRSYKLSSAKLLSPSSKRESISTFLGDGELWIKLFLCCMHEYANDSCKDGVDQLMLSQRAMGNRGHYEPGSFFGTGHGCGSVSTRADFITPYIICTCVCVWSVELYAAWLLAGKAWWEGFAGHADRSCLGISWPVEFEVNSGSAMLVGWMARLWRDHDQSLCWIFQHSPLGCAQTQFDSIPLTVVN